MTVLNVVDIQVINPRPSINGKYWRIWKGFRWNYESIDYEIILIARKISSCEYFTDDFLLHLYFTIKYGYSIQSCKTQNVCTICF